MMKSFLSKGNSDLRVKRSSRNVSSSPMKKFSSVRTLIADAPFSVYMSATWMRSRCGARIPLEGEARLSSAIKLNLTPNPSPFRRGELRRERTERKSRGAGEASARWRKDWASSVAISVFLCARIRSRMSIMQSCSRYLNKRLTEIDQRIELGKSFTAIERYTGLFKRGLEISRLGGKGGSRIEQDCVTTS